MRFRGNVDNQTLLLQGTIARLSARLESSIAKESILKQRLHQLEASQSNQQPASHAARTAQDLGRQGWAGQLLPLRAAASRDSLVPGDTAAQQCVQHEGCVQTQRAVNPQGQTSHGSQHQSDKDHLMDTQDIAGTSITIAKEPKLQQEVIDRLEGELQDVKACLAREQAELEELRRYASLPIPVPNQGKHCRDFLKFHILLLLQRAREFIPRSIWVQWEKSALLEANTTIARCSASAPAADQASVGSRMVSDKGAGLLTGAQDDAKELRSELAKTRQRCGQPVALHY